VRATTTARPATAGGARELQFERLAMPGGPVGDDVGDNLAVVIGCENVRGTGGAHDVDPVHPGISGQDDVEEVAQRPDLFVISDELSDGHGAASHQTWRAPPAAHCLRSALCEAVDDLSGRHVGSFVDLQLSQRIDEYPTTAAG
jgi:hypothetical protein